MLCTDIGINIIIIAFSHDYSLLFGLGKPVIMNVIYQVKGVIITRENTIHTNITKKTKRSINTRGEDYLVKVMGNRDIKQERAFKEESQSTSHEQLQKENLLLF